MAENHIRTEHELEEELLRIYQEGARLGNRANRFYQLFTPKCKNYRGGIKAVRRIVEKGPSTGFQWAVEHGRSDLLLEHLVLDPKWQHLFAPFAPELQRKARENLSTISK